MHKKTELLGKLYKRDGHTCHYCGIKEKEFLRLWGEFYGLPYRGRRLEVEHKDTVVIQGNYTAKMGREDTPEKCVLACSLCNMAKSNMFTYNEFKKVGRVIEEIWLTRKIAALKFK